MAWHSISNETCWINRCRQVLDLHFYLHEPRRPWIKYNFTPLVEKRCLFQITFIGERKKNNCFLTFRFKYPAVNDFILRLSLMKRKLKLLFNSRQVWDDFFFVGEGICRSPFTGSFFFFFNVNDIFMSRKLR